MWEFTAKNAGFEKNGSFTGKNAGVAEKWEFYGEVGGKVGIET